MAFKRLNMRQVEAFRAVMVLGSATKAAEMLGISQPAVSRLIQSFTRAVGFTLFKRQGGGSVPTKDAERLYDEVEALVLGLDELGQRVNAIRNLEVGTVRIAAMSIYANGLLPEMVAEFMARHPGLSIALDSQPQNRVVELVESRRCDIGFTTLPIPSTQMTAHKLASRPAVCVMPAGHALAGKAYVGAQDLAGLPFVSFPRGTPFRYRIDTVFERAGLQRELRIEAGTHEAVCSLVAAGIGVSVVNPYSSIIGHNPKLAFRPFRPALDIEVGLVAEESRMSGAARRFCKFAIDYFHRHIGRGAGAADVVEVAAARARQKRSAGT